MRAFRGAASQSSLGAGVAAQLFAIAALLGGCVPAALERGGPVSAPPAAQAAFEVSGRLSAHHGSEALAASFHWWHGSERDELELATPLGQTLARLSGDASQVRLQAADGRVLIADDWTALTEEGLGWPLPVRGLSFWIQGVSRPDTTVSIELGDDGRAVVLRQDGWMIVYQAYAQTATEAWRPSRMTLTYPDVELRLVIDSWQ